MRSSLYKCRGGRVLSVWFVMPQVEKHGPCSGPARRSFHELGGASLCGLGLGTLARETGSKRLLSEDDPAVGYTPARDPWRNCEEIPERGKPQLGD